jgi:acetyl-CoA C-acetyltransferase
MRNVGIIGVGQTQFVTRRTDVTFPELVREGARLALEDAGLGMDDIDAIVFPLAPDALIGVGNGERWCVEALGAQGKPFMRINTGGSTGLTAVQAGYIHVASGMFDRVLVAGADRVSESASAQSVLNKMWDVAYERLYPLNTITMLALSAQRYNAIYGADERDQARVTVKNRRHASLNPHAHLRELVTEDDVMDSRLVSWPLKLGDLCPSSTGAAAVVLGSEDVAARSDRPPAWIRGIGQNSETFWMGDRVGPQADGDHADADALALAIDRAYAQAGVTEPAAQIDVAELYAPFTHQELILRDALGLAKPNGTAINPSGGALAANPMMAAGLIRIGEAATRISKGEANRALAHATSGPCLQQNLVAVLEGD